MNFGFQHPFPINLSNVFFGSGTRRGDPTDPPKAIETVNEKQCFTALITTNRAGDFLDILLVTYGKSMLHATLFVNYRAHVWCLYLQVKRSGPTRPVLVA